MYGFYICNICEDFMIRNTLRQWRNKMFKICFYLTQGISNKSLGKSVFKLWNVSFKQFPAMDMEIVYIEILQINLFVNFLSDWIF